MAEIPVKEVLKILQTQLEILKLLSTGSVVVGPESAKLFQAIEVKHG